MPEQGKALLDEIPPHLREALRASHDERGDGGVVLPYPVWRDAFFNDGTDEHAREVYEVLRPQPYDAFIDAADMTGWDQVTPAFSCIAPHEDNDITQGEWGRNPRLSNRLGTFRVIGMAGSHEVLLMNPRLTAETFIEVWRN